CPWQGPYHELTVHEAECTHPTKTGNELMEILDEMDQTRKKEMQLYNSIFSLLSFEKIGYTEVQFRPYRTDDFITRLYYETPRPTRPYDDVQIRPVIYHFVFSNESNETDYLALPIRDSVECNKLLAAKNINLRLFLFQIQK
ncbi:CYHR1 protein, partial [Ibidorhyncha struthersii]|nr:CYHR1 protein [Ibidorhyncha struthersii]